MVQKRRAKSSAANVDAAWKRIVKRIERAPFLPMAPEECVWEDIRYTAADARSNVTVEDVAAHRSDLTLVQQRLGYIPSLPGKP